MTDTPAPAADEPVVDPKSEETPQETELTTAEQQAIDDLGGVEGKLTDNEAPEGLNDSTPATDTPEEVAPAGEDAGAKPDEGTPAPETAETETPEPVETEAPVEPAPELTTDPGDFQPADYSFDVITTDGKTHKISTPEDADAFAASLDDNPELINASQYSIFNKKSAVMEVGIATDRREYEATKQKYETEQALEQTRQDTVNEINSGFNYLQAKGELEPLTPELNVAGAWERNADNPLVKQRLDILSYMEKENEARLAAGLKPTFDVIATHNSMQLEAMRTQETTTKQKETETRQKRGSMVSGKSPYQPDTQPQGSIVGQGGSLNDLLLDFE